MAQYNGHHRGHETICENMNTKCNKMTAKFSGSYPIYVTENKISRDHCTYVDSLRVRPRAFDGRT